MLAAFKSVRWVFFDVGYTLFDETPAWHDRFEAMASLLREQGRDVTVAGIWDAFHDLCQSFGPLHWAGLCERLGDTPEQALALNRLNNGWRHELEIAYPDVPPLLRAMHGQYRLGIIANQSAGTVQRLAERGLGEYFDLVIGSAEAGVRKPDPAIFRLALDKAGCPAEQAVMVGDRIDNDIAPAKALGLHTIHVRQGGGGRQRARSAAEMPDASAESIGDVAGLFGLSV